MQRRFFLLGVVLFLVGAFLWIGCTKDQNTAPEQLAQDPPVDTPDRAMQHFKEAYGQRDIDDYSDILHDDYKFFFQEHDITTLGLTSDHFLRIDEIDVSTNMFSGEPINNPGGVINPIPSISDIEISLLEREGTWGPSYHPNLVNAQRALFRIEFSITRAGARSISITGRQEFYVADRGAVQPDGTVLPDFRVVGQVDMSDMNKNGSKPSACTSWGALKILYR